MLLMYINNIVKNPTVPRYRRVSTTNNSYMKSLSAVQGHEALLSAVGFARKAESNHFEYEWHSLPTATADSASVDNKNVTDKPRSAQEATALLTVEGELDDISGAGQTRAAHKLCTGIPSSNQKHYDVIGAGHYGIFSGRRWREMAYPEIRSFILAHNK